jgi:hypothetical protein
MPFHATGSLEQARETSSDPSQEHFVLALSSVDFDRR